VDDYIDRLKAATPANARLAAGLAEVDQEFQAGNITLGEARTRLENLRGEYNAAAPAAEKFGLAIKGIGTMVGIASVAIYGLDQAVDQVMDFGKAGAELLYLQDRFDRLSGSIGTTSDRLMGDLKAATQGLVADADLVASAGDLMALGLAKSREEVVRLTTVAGALGMDMNQLVLTLTNQTTMRFDALGVSVDGFDEKVEKLKKTGLSAGEAFKEAFLQQAEEQLERVGNKADSAAAAFLRLEAAEKNYADQQKRMMGPILAEGAELITEYMRRTEETETLWMRFIPTLGGAQIVVHGLGAAFDRTTDATEQATDAAYQLTEAEERARDAVEKNRGGIERMRAALSDTRGEIGNSTSSVERYELAIRNANQSMYEAEQAAKAAAAGYDAYREAQDRLEEAQTNFSQGVGGEMAQLFDDAGLSADQYREVLGIIDEVTGTATQKQYDQKEAMKELVDLYKAKGPEAFRDGLQEVIDKFSPFDESVRKSKQEVMLLLDEYNKLVSKDVYITVHTIRKEYDYMPENQFWTIDDEENYRAAGCPVVAGVPYIVGERGPEVFVPQQSGQIVPNDKLSAGGITIEQLNITVPDVRYAVDYELLSYRIAQEFQRARR
jgi:hypothetical protein